MDKARAQAHDTQHTNPTGDDGDGDDRIHGGEEIIPFADETGGTGAPARSWDTTPAVESGQMDAHDQGVCAGEELAGCGGELADQDTPRVSPVDRDLGLGGRAMNPSAGRYACPCCGQGARRVVRVRLAAAVSPGKDPRWVALCAVCAASMLSSVPGTVVGGLVRPSRRKRASRARASAGGAGQTPHGFRPGSPGEYRRAG